LERSAAVGKLASLAQKLAFKVIPGTEIWVKCRKQVAFARQFTVRFHL
jgi:hypothetical protein